MRLLFKTATIIGVLAPALVAAQAIPPFKPDMSKMSASRDSFVVLINGAPSGFLVRDLSRSANRIIEKQRSDIGGMLIEATVEMHDTGRPISSRTDGSAGGMSIRIHVAYTSDKVTVEGAMPTANGEMPIKGDTTISATTIDEGQIPTLLSYAALEAGAKFSIDVFTGTAAKRMASTIEVAAAKEKVEVPAGTFDAYKVTYQTADQTMIVYYTTDPSHRLIKMVPVGQPIEIVLAR